MKTINKLRSQRAIQEKHCLPISKGENFQRCPSDLSNCVLLIFSGKQAHLLGTFENSTQISRSVQRKGGKPCLRALNHVRDYKILRDVAIKEDYMSDQNVSIAAARMNEKGHLSKSSSKIFRNIRKVGSHNWMTHFWSLFHF